MALTESRITESVEKKECSICCEEIIQNETGEVILSCSHSYHFICILKWYNSQCESDQQSSCPYCRRKVKDIENIPYDSDSDSSVDSDNESESECEDDLEDHLEEQEQDDSGYEGNESSDDETESSITQ
jgi:hypothetical protein